MNNLYGRRRLGLAAGLLGLTTVLTACPRPLPPPPLSESKTAVLSFQFPALPSVSNLRLAALYFEVDAAGKSTPKALGSTFVGSGATQASLYLDGYSLDTLKKNPKCVTPFKTGEASSFTAVNITPDTVTTCNVYFSLFRDQNGDGLPTKSEELYLTHSIYGYASVAFTYDMTSPDGKSRETGTRRAGWSLVRHEVLQPASTPGQYHVTMNSVPADDQGIAIRLHEDTDRLISQGLNGGQR